MNWRGSTGSAFDSVLAASEVNFSTQEGQKSPEGQKGQKSINTAPEGQKSITPRPKNDRGRAHALPPGTDASAGPTAPSGRPTEERRITEGPRSANVPPPEEPK